MKLDVWLRQERPLDERLRVVECLCQAVNEVHDRGESLAALEPVRIELGSGGECDLSAARQGSPAPGYAAPDADGDAPAALADVYSAGAIAWEILAGRPAGDSPAHLFKVRSDLPRELADAVMACLERSADWRPKDLTYLAQMAAAQQKSSAPSRPSPRAARAPRAAPARASEGRPSRRTWPLLAALVVVIGLAAAAGWQYIGSGATTSPAGATPPTPPTMVASAPATTLPAPDTTGVVPTPTPATTEPTPAPAAPAPAPVTTDPATRPTATTAVAPQPTRVEPQPPAPTPTPTPMPAAPAPVTLPEPAPAPPDPGPQVEAPPPDPAPRVAPPAPPAPPAEPIVLATVSPLEVRRPGKVMLDLRGSGFRPDLQPRIVPLKKAPRGIAVIGQKFVNASLIKVLVELGENAETGEFAIAVEDGVGTRSEPAVFTVTK